MRRAIVTAAALVAVGLAAASFAAGPAASRTGDAVETPDSLPDFPGREEAFGYCIGCHSFQVIGRQGMSRERWDETLTWMTTRHNMPAPDETTRKVLLDYLAAAYPDRPAAGRGGWVNPFAPQR